MKSFSARFWETKSLDQMSSNEWESLCDGCGRCCLVKLEDEDSGEVYFTNASCRLLDREGCHCVHYAERLQHVPDCINLTPQNVAAISWLPSTCAYRLLLESKPLPEWHPLISGDKDSVHHAGISVRGRVICETGVKVEDLEDHIIHWVY